MLATSRNFEAATQTGLANQNLQRALGQVARLKNSFRIDHAHNHVDGVFFEPLQFSEMRNRHERAIDIKRIEPLSFGPACHVSPWRWRSM